MFIGVLPWAAQLSADFRESVHFPPCGHLGPDVNTASPKRRDAATRNEGAAAVAEIAARLLEVGSRLRRNFRRIGCFASSLFEI
jgi:hypothetical protein